MQTSKISIQQTKIDWEGISKKGDPLVKYKVRDASGRDYFTWDKTIGTAASGQEFDVLTETKPGYGDNGPETWVRLPQQTSGGFAKKPFTPRDHGSEERAKYPSFALAYAKDIIVAEISANMYSMETTTEAVDYDKRWFELADQALAWLENKNGPKSQNSAIEVKLPTQDGDINLNSLPF